uniref:Uncharacterized protein n=1 Tax=Cyanothece sp. (strain PCC 7425 / ATCC 29141) TaxID=395961 RepID=B8HTS9_CYAP4
MEQTAHLPTAAQEFHHLQAQLDACWRGTESFIPDQPGIVLSQNRDILVVPSLSLDQGELNKIEGYHHYEERQLFSLIQLRNPRTRMIFVTSQPLHPSIIDYYLDLLPGVPSAHARDRLLLLSTYDQSPKPLTQKILERPRLLQRIRQSLRPGQSYMVCFNSTQWERDLALQLGVPLFAVDPDLLYWGTKAGSRELFAEAQIAHPAGRQTAWNIPELASLVAQLWEEQPQVQRLVVKLNEGFSGEGNALLDLTKIPQVAPGLVSPAERISTIEAHLSSLRFQAPQETWPSYSRRLPELGAIVECYLEGDHKQSPSVQGRITPCGGVEIISTHDQILEGPDGQIFKGCRFPADARYRLALQDLGLQVGQQLARKGAIGHYGVDFLARPQADGSWDVQAIEINLRKGGTTHPFMTLKFLTNGYYDLSSGLFYSKHGRPKYYIASDNLQSPHYRGLLPNDLMDIIASYQLHFDSSTETGTVFHLIGALSEFGKLGLTSIGNSPEEAEAVYEQTIAVLDQETQGY